MFFILNFSRCKEGIWFTLNRNSGMYQSGINSFSVALESNIMESSLKFFRLGKYPQSILNDY